MVHIESNLSGAAASTGFSHHVTFWSQSAYDSIASFGSSHSIESISRTLFGTKSAWSGLQVGSSL